MLFDKLSDTVQLSFRLPMPVTHVRCHRDGFGLSSYPVCPRCASSMDREYQNYCDRCGQQLSWKAFHKTTAIVFGK